MSKHDLDEQDKEHVKKFLDYLSKETTWRYVFRQLDRLETITLWDDFQVLGTAVGVSIGTVVELLKIPVEELVNKNFSTYTKGWELQLLYYRFQDAETI
jgi:uncharacterized membrane protein